jgi:hypothetical protein
MNRGVRALGISLAIGVAAALAPAAASALVLSYNPSTLNFGTHAYGTSTTLTTTCTVTCDSPPGMDCGPPTFMGSYAPERLAVAPDSFTQSNNCDEPMQPTVPMPASCTITVTFSPLVNGAITGVLYDVNSGTGMNLNGTGVGAPTTPTTASPTTTTTKCKKKKKKHSAQSAKKKKKKCKKKKKKKKK